MSKSKYEPAETETKTKTASAVPPEGALGPPDDAPSPPYATTTTAEAGTVPREVKELERAPEGYARYKIRCDNHEGHRTRYILAKKGDVDSAKKCFLVASGLAALIESMKKSGAPLLEPILVVRELPD